MEWTPLKDILKTMYINNQIETNYITVRFTFSVTDSLFTCKVKYISDLNMNLNFHKFMMIKHFVELNTVIYIESGAYKTYSDKSAA